MCSVLLPFIIFISLGWCFFSSFFFIFLLSVPFPLLPGYYYCCWCLFFLLERKRERSRGFVFALIWEIRERDSESEIKKRAREIAAERAIQNERALFGSLFYEYNHVWFGVRISHNREKRAPTHAHSDSIIMCIMHLPPWHFFSVFIIAAIAIAITFVVVHFFCLQNSLYAQTFFSRFSISNIYVHLCVMKLVSCSCIAV